VAGRLTAHDRHRQEAAAHVQLVGELLGVPELQAELTKRVVDVTPEAAVQHAALQLEAAINEAQSNAECIALYRRCTVLYALMEHLVDVSLRKSESFK